MPFRLVRCCPCRHEHHHIVASGYHLGVLNTCISVMARQWGVSDVTLSPYATSALLVGAAVGCLVGGAAADAFGPRHALFYNNIVLLAGAWLCAVSQQPLTLCIGAWDAKQGMHQRRDRSVGGGLGLRCCQPVCTPLHCRGSPARCARGPGHADAGVGVHTRDTNQCP